MDFCSEVTGVLLQKYSPENLVKIQDIIWVKVKFHQPQNIQEETVKIQELQEITGARAIPETTSHSWDNKRDVELKKEKKWSNYLLKPQMATPFEIWDLGFEFWKQMAICNDIDLHLQYFVWGGFYDTVHRPDLVLWSGWSRIHHKWGTFASIW